MVSKSRGNLEPLLQPNKQNDMKKSKQKNSERLIAKNDKAICYQSILQSQKVITHESVAMNSKIRAIVAALTVVFYGTAITTPIISYAADTDENVNQVGSFHQDASRNTGYNSVVQSRNQTNGEIANQVYPRQVTVDPAGQPPVGVYADTSQNGAVDYRANAAVGKIEVEVDKVGLPADGQSASEVTVKLFDIKAQPLNQTAFITVEVSGGRLLLPGAKTDELGPEGLDLDKVTPGTQIKVVNGQASFKLLAPMEPQDVKMRITAGNVYASGSISFLPELREMVAVGLIEGIISKRHISSGALSPARAGDGFEQEINRWSRQFDSGKANLAMRTAFFVKGKIKGDALLTAAYDSDKETRSRMLRDIRPDEFYPVYGDSSIVGFEARSSERLYVRVDKEKSYILYGDFMTGSGFSQQAGGGTVADVQLRNLGQYNRTATGIRGHYEKNNVVANAFVTRDSLKQVIEEYPANGTSGPFAVKNNSALENSEKIEIVVRDKNQVNLIKQVTQLTRFEDYVFEPFSGRILLKTPIMALTPNGDAQSLRITYEVDQGGKEFWVAGVDGQAKLTKNLEVGGSIVEDRNPLSPYRLGSANVGLRLGLNTIVVAEVAHSQSTKYQNGANLYATPTGQPGETKLDSSGNAYRVEIATQGDKVAGSTKNANNWDAKAWWAKSDVGFDNNATGYTQGKGEAGARANVRINDTFSVNGEAIRSEDKLVNAKRTGELIGITAKVSDKLTLNGFVRHISENTNYPTGALIGSNSAPLGTSGTVAGGFYGLGVDRNGFASTGLATATTAASQNLDATTVGLGAHYQATDKIGLDGMVERGGSNQKRLILGMDYQLAERTKLYARGETQTGLASAYSLNAGDRSTSFVAGVDTSYMQNGSLFSEYRLRDAMSGQQANLADMQLANGLRNTWNISEGITASTGIEYLRVLKGDNRNALALTGGMDYTANPLWKLSGRLEYRRLFDDKTVAGDQSQDQWLSTLAVARKLDRDWTLLGRNYLLYSKNNDNSTGTAPMGNAIQDRFQVGAAWRPVDTNTVNALARYEYKMSRDESQTSGDNYRTHILSAHMDYHPTRPWWFTGHIAGKSTVDYTLPADQRYSAYLLSGRAVYDITEKWDLGVLGSVMYSPQGQSKQWATGLEAGYQLQDNLWVSAGYNWLGFEDKDLTGSDYTAQGLYLRLRYKFDENLFSGSDEKVNRTLNRTAQ